MGGLRCCAFSAGPVNPDVILPERFQMESKSKTESRRWFFTFSLRTFLILFSGLAVCLSFVVHKDSVRRSAAMNAESYGARVTWKERGPTWLKSLVGRDLFATPHEIGFLNEPLADDDLTSLIGLEDAEQLMIMQNATFSGDGFRHLSEFNKLKWIHVYDAPVTDAGCSHLIGLESLERIELLATLLTKESLPALERIGNLTELSIGSEYLERADADTLRKSMPNTKIRISKQGFSQ